MDDSLRPIGVAVLPVYLTNSVSIPIDDAVAFTTASCAGWSKVSVVKPLRVVDAVKLNTGAVCGVGA